MPGSRASEESERSPSRLSSDLLGTVKEQLESLACEVRRFENSLTLALPAFEQRLIQIETRTGIDPIVPPRVVESEHASVASAIDQLRLQVSRITRRLRSHLADESRLTQIEERFKDAVKSLRTATQEELNRCDRDWRELMQRREDAWKESIEKTRGELWEQMRAAEARLMEVVAGHARGIDERMMEIQATLGRLESERRSLKEAGSAPEALSERLGSGFAELREKLATLEDGFSQQITALEQRFDLAFHEDRASARQFRWVVLTALAILFLLLLKL